MPGGSQNPGIDLSNIDLTIIASEVNVLLTPEQFLHKISQPSFEFDQYNKSFLRGKKRYELTNHLSNVLTTISDRKSVVSPSGGGAAGGGGNYVSVIKSANDYYPGGMLAPDRTYDASHLYRFKHQGQESDDEIAGNGSNYFYKYRMSDARLNRFWSVDKKVNEKVNVSPYNFSENSFIAFLEREGLEKYSVHVAITAQSYPTRSNEDPVPFKKSVGGAEVNVLIKAPSVSGKVIATYDTDTHEWTYKFEGKGNLITVVGEVNIPNVGKTSLEISPSFNYSYDTKTGKRKSKAELIRYKSLYRQSSSLEYDETNSKFNNSLSLSDLNPFNILDDDHVDFSVPVGNGKLHFQVFDNYKYAGV